MGGWMDGWMDGRGSGSDSEWRGERGWYGREWQCLSGVVVTCRRGGMDKR